MPVFVEKLLIPLAVAVFLALAFTNPMGFDWIQRITGLVGTLSFASFISYTLHRYNERQKKQPAATSAPQVPPDKPLPVGLPPPQSLAPLPRGLSVSQETPPQPETTLPPQPMTTDSRGRVFISDSLKDLVSLTHNRTTLESKRETKRYVGKWLKVAGTVTEVDVRLGEITVTLRVKEGDNATTVFADFSEPQWSHHLSVLRRGHVLSLEGRIESVYDSWVGLKECELPGNTPVPVKTAS